MYREILSTLKVNRNRIEEKLSFPSKVIQLNKSNSLIESLNIWIKQKNELVHLHNSKIDNLTGSMQSIRTKFWTLNRYEYNDDITELKNIKKTIYLKNKELVNSTQEFDSKVLSKKEKLLEQQKKTINIDKAITNINLGLEKLGIEGFSIKKYESNFYKIVRSENSNRTFFTLSEGEKTIITFLYFKEICFGKSDTSSLESEKIIIIDDPISSLSHIFIFNIGEIIKKEFFNNSSVKQVFVLTHSLYFFYELTLINPTKRQEQQKLFRISKNSEGSKIHNMKYEEIQNDYHSYWHIVKDADQNNALIANCMRNIVEYFFNFIEKKDFNNVFQKRELKDNKYQAFYRFMNRESHSLGQNIYDFKEFNYDDFSNAFKLMFELNGYKDHYQKMIK